MSRKGIDNNFVKPSAEEYKQKRKKNNSIAKNTFTK